MVASATLEEGAAWCETTFGVAPAAGGKHLLFGTHNLLLKIGSEEFPDAYLEIIAIDPMAAMPKGPRWFGLDCPHPGPPRLLHAVARCEALAALREELHRAGFDAGEPLSLSRDTAVDVLRWIILVPADGKLPGGGALPTLIEWQGRHPAAALPDSGVKLRALDWVGMPQGARDILLLRGVDHTAGDAALHALFDTPRGELRLFSETA